MEKIPFTDWVNESPDHEEIVKYLTEERASIERGAQYPNQFLYGLAVNYIDKQIVMSDAQAMSAISTIRRRKETAARIAEDANRHHEPPPLGTQTITGEVVGIKHVPNKFGRGTIMKLMIDCGPYKVYGTCPMSLRYVNGQHGDRPIGAGDMVQLTAEIKPSANPSMGYYSSPREVLFLGTASHSQAS